MSKVELNLANKIAKVAHKNQVDKAGEPYIEHPKAVQDMVNGDRAKTVAILHDVIEDTDITLDKLYSLGIMDLHILDAIDCLTKRAEEDYYMYLKRVKSNNLAVIVKRADIAHNMSEKRLNGIDPNLKQYFIQKYRKGLLYLDSGIRVLILTKEECGYVET